MEKFINTQTNGVKLYSTPLDKNFKLNELSKKLLTDKEYRGIVGSLIYAYNNCFPEIGYAVGYLSRYLHNPTEEL